MEFERYPRCISCLNDSYAFKSGNELIMNKYQMFFDRFVEAYETSKFEDLSRLQRMQFLYLASEYLKLGGTSNALSAIIEEKAHEDLLTTATWKVEPTVKEHLIKALANKQYKYSYFSKIVDADFYTLACLCDLKDIGVQNEDTKFAEDYVLEMLSSSVMNTVTDEGYWLFQVGVAKDYKDYSYAGNEFSYEGMEPKVKEDIVTDSSHFRRMPLWLVSFRDAQNTDEQKELIQDRINQLAKLFSEKVLRQKNGYWVTTTFIDGTNGVFRYDYHDDGNSIEGYNQSGGTFFLGYWIMLDSDFIRNVYQDILTKLPLPADSTNPYYDDGITIREQNPLMDRDNLWDNGLMETIVRCMLAL